MAQPIGSRAEAEVALERLFDHLEAWLLQQQEILLIWVQPRHVRKDVEQAIAKLLTTIPARDNVEANRAWRREITRRLEKADKDWWQGITL